MIKLSIRFGKARMLKNPQFPLKNDYGVRRLGGCLKTHWGMKRRERKGDKINGEEVERKE